MTELSSEPSMEDILASIKKIIAEDTDKKLSPLAPRHDRPVEEAVVEAQIEAGVDAADEEHDVLELSAAEETSMDVEIEAAPLAAPQTTAIVSDETSAASRNALQALSALVVKPDITGSDTLEGMVQEMLRPMLKQWLDARLPEIVEALVAKEVARISGRTL
jgi:cell pole-organizing protein PopZ